VKNFLDNFVLKIVPMLNPDGCDRGHWRCDTQGINLNRVYREPDPVWHPTIYGVKQAIAHEFSKGTLIIYTDFHAHAMKRGCFVFGNYFEDKEKHIEQLLLPKLISLNSVNFDARECSYKDDVNNKKDRSGDSRAGSGRATICSITSLPYCFTLEGNYARGIRINTLNPRVDITTGKRFLKEDN
jgi:hypothetical protein